MRFKQNGTELKSPTRSALLKNFTDAFSERPIEPIEVEPSILRRWTRRDLLLFGAGALATLAVGGSQLPRKVLRRLGLAQGETTGPENKWLLNKAQRLDDDVSATLYSKHHLVPTYTKSQITPLKNNYNGTTPDPAYIPGWRLTLDGLSSGLAVSLDIRALLAHQIHDQITRLVCVEGWSAIAWWSGLRFDDLLHAYPPVSQAKWAYIESSVNLDANGNPDPYFVSIDLLTAQHPQTLLATNTSSRL
jgi:DMSO/TMAO reductase YedYZ molybdopterin-dependent catalytic subunit